MKKIPFGISLIFAAFFLVVGCKTSDVASTTPEKEEQAVVDADSLASQEEVLPAEAIYEYHPEATKWNDLVHTRLKVNFDWNNHYLLGDVVLELKPHFYPQDQVILDAKGFEILSVSLLEGENKSPLNFQYDGELLEIALGKEYTRDEHYFIHIEYVAKPDELEVGGSEAITQDKGLYFIEPDELNPDKPYQIWTQGETEASSCWFPTIDSPNQKTTQEIYITVGDSLKTLSNGVLGYSRQNSDGTRTDYWKMDKPHAPYLVMMAIGDFAVVEDKWKGVPLTYYVEPEYEQHAKAIFGNTPEMIGFFSEKLGYQYPWSKYAQVVVRDYVSGAMENTTASVFMEEVQVDSRYLVDENWDGIIAHELFHQWFGDLVTCESWPNLPLNEAFANYSEYLWEEYKNGQEDADYLALNEMSSYFQEAQEKQVDLIRFHYEDKEDMFDNHSYAKGGRILHMLRSYVGDDAFFKSLQYYLKTNEYSTVEVHQLRLAFEKITGQDLNWFFNQWFLASGHPQLRIENQFDSINNVLTLEIWQEQDPSTTPYYILPLEVALWNSGTKASYDIELLDVPYQKFELRTESKPELVVFDAEKDLLAEIDYAKSNAEWAIQYEVSENYISKYRSLEALARQTDSISLDVYRRALMDSHWSLRQLALSFAEEHFEEYTNPQEIVSKIEQMAKEDENNIVRADAMVILAEMNANQYASLFQNNLTDSSYYVTGAALYGYAKTNKNDIAEVFEKNEHINNTNVLIPVANYYVENQKFEKYDWFVQKIEGTNKVNRYYMLQLFGQLLMLAPEDMQKDGVEVLNSYAKNDQTYYVRLSAYQALSLLTDVPGVEEMRKQIKKEEQDDRLKVLYEKM